MKLGIISDCVHYKAPDGSIGTETHILLRQLEALSSYFSETLICCPFANKTEAKVLSFYSKKNIRFLPVPVVGGDSLKDKLKIATVIPKWLTAFRKVNGFSDIVYQRFPNNLNIPGFFFFYLNQKNVFGTYTGTWADYKTEPRTYRFQKWLLKKYFRGPVWVYADNCSMNNKIFSGFSPSYTKAEWDEETLQVETRLEKIKNEGIKFFRLITVGTLIDYKNQLTILKACLILKSRNFPFYLTVVGSGPMYNDLDRFIKENDLSGHATLAGKKNYVELRELYRKNDFVVQAPLSEGFGKVPIEGFFHGLIPVINDVSMAKNITANGERGFLFNAKDPVNLADTIEAIKGKADELASFIVKGREYAKSQTLDAWAETYYKTVTNYFEKA